MCMRRLWFVRRPDASVPTSKGCPEGNLADVYGVAGREMSVAFLQAVTYGPMDAATARTAVPAAFSFSFFDEAVACKRNSAGGPVASTQDDVPHRAVHRHRPVHRRGPPCTMRTVPKRSAPPTCAYREQQEGIRVERKTVRPGDRYRSLETGVVWRVVSSNDPAGENHVRVVRESQPFDLRRIPAITLLDTTRYVPL